MPVGSMRLVGVVRRWRLVTAAILFFDSTTEATGPERSFSKEVGQTEREKRSDSHPHHGSERDVAEGDVGGHGKR
eukprot:scaffold9772_cov71-Cylindrotheca_fusiformis.AAC.1